MIMTEDIKEVLLSKEELEKIVSDLGKRISDDYRGKDLVLVSVLKGSVVFMADLMRNQATARVLKLRALSELLRTLTEMSRVWICLLLRIFSTAAER